MVANEHAPPSSLNGYEVEGFATTIGFVSVGAWVIKEQAFRHITKAHLSS